MLTFLKTTGAIGSKSWGFWQGWTGAEASQQLDGSLIIGGYDEAKLTGPNVTLPIQYDDSCPGGLLITVTDITMNLKNGSDLSILGASHASALRVCVNPTPSFIGMPYDMWTGFLNNSGSTEVGRSDSHLNFFSMLVQGDTA